MIRTAARKAFLLAALTLSVGAVAVNCSHRDSDPAGSAIGSVGLAITLPSGATVSTVHYSIKNGSAVEVASGNVNTSDPGATVSFVVGGLAAGPGYTIVLTGTASDGSSCMGTSAPFAVVANQSTAVTILLLCRGTIQTGVVAGNGVVDNCPVITSYVVSPLAVSAGGAIDVSAAATDLDASDTVTYKWTAAAGSFDAPASATTKYHCPATSSQQTLTITVSDNIDAASNAPKCSTPTTIVVNCGLCGDSVVQASAGETCDPPNGTTCDSSCHTIALICGNGIVQPGEQCDPPNGTTCNNACQNITVVCGNNIVQPGEQCDPPNGTTCDTACRNIPIACGNNIVQPGEQCDPPGPIANSTTTVCSATCQIVAAPPPGTGGAVGTGGVTATGGAVGTGGAVATGGSTGAGGMSGGDPSGATAACVACEDVGTGSTTNTKCATNQRCDALTDASGALDPVAIAKCYGALKCMRINHCAVGGDNSLCYCSRTTQEGGQCANGMPDGPCAAAFEAADPNIVAGDSAAVRAGKILSDLSDPANPMGRAGRNVGTCDQGKCAIPCAGQF